MSKNIEEELEILNENLKAIVVNQAMIYCKLLEIERKMEKDLEKGLDELGKILKNIMKNQAALYEELKTIKNKLPKPGDVMIV